jgi:eukaryotic-like serine/threonine-protein kinase
MTAAPEPEREQVGPYKLIAAIGAGGSARIDLARIDRAYSFQRHVVVKRPLEHLRADRAARAQLEREARIGGRLRHPNLVAVLDAGTHDGYPYLVLEYVHGSSLRTLMQTEVGGRVRELPVPVALGIAIDVARGMHDAHELTDEHGAPLGLVHRDVSPGNILLGSDGTVKLADFGIAKETRVSTLSGSMHGTVTYMAPEQCRGHAFDRRADIFSLGVILYELVTETRLFWADNDVASLHRVLSGNVPRPRKIKPHLPPVLEEIVMTALAHDAERRFATARQLADALEGHAAHEGLVLGARRLAGAMEQAFGRQQAPWVAARTVVDPPGEGSLVEIIAAAAPPDEPLLPTFGPSEDGADEAALTPVPQPRRRSKAPLAIAILLAVVAGSAATYLAMSWIGDDRAREITTRPTPPPPAQQPVTKPEPPRLTSTPTEASTPPPTIPTVPNRSPTRPTRRIRTPPVADKQPEAPPVVEPPAPPRVEPKHPTTGDWDPGKLYPEDFKKKP